MSELREETTASTQPVPDFVRRDIDWEPLRRAFIERPLRPTYADLESEFGVKRFTIGRCAADEGWVTLRSGFLDRQLESVDAKAVLLKAISNDRAFIHSLADYAIVSIREIRAVVESIPEDRAPSTKLEAHNTANFAIRNLCAALKDVGVVGLPKGMTDGKEDNGRWNPQMLSQINLTVQNLVSQAGGKPTDPPAAAPVVVPSGAEKPGPITGKSDAPVT